MDGSRRILSLDGGGIRGALPISFLARIEQLTRERIVDHFDLIAGTSTGGIIAIGLGLGLSATEILEFYQSHGPVIFGAAPGAAGSLGRRLWLPAYDRLAQRSRRVRHWFGPKHDKRRLRQALEGVLGERLLGESQTRLLIPAYHNERRSAYVFKTSHHQRLEVDHLEKAVDVAIATASAPTYFAGHALPNGAHLSDGGTWANNPMGLAVVEAIGVLGWDRHSLKVLSLGCGDDVLVPNLDAGLTQLGKDVVGLFMQGQSVGAYGTAKLLAGEANVHRIDPAVPHGRFSLDDTTKIDQLVGMGAACAREALPMIRREFLLGPKEEFRPFHGHRS